MQVSAGLALPGGSRGGPLLPPPAPGGSRRSLVYGGITPYPSFTSPSVFVCQISLLEGQLSLDLGHFLNLG